MTTMKRCNLTKPLQSCGTAEANLHDASEPVVVHATCGFPGTLPVGTHAFIELVNGEWWLIAAELPA